jgi:hypothetical protein
MEIVTMAGDCLAPSKKTLSDQYARELVLIKDTTRIRLRFSEIELNDGAASTPIAWSGGFDTLVVGKTKSVEDYIHTSDFTVPQDGRIKFRVTGLKRGHHAPSDSLRFRVQLMDLATNQELIQLGNHHPRSMGQGKSDNTYNASIGSAAGQAVYLRLRMEHPDSTFGMEAIDSYIPSGGKFPKSVDHGNVELNERLENVLLQQNYPNPFNPSTEITYLLPSSSPIRLVLYDVYGRQIAILDQGEKSAGEHRFAFNAEGYPSGVYLYRLVAGKSILTRKLVLLK